MREVQMMDSISSIKTAIEEKVQSQTLLCSGCRAGPPYEVISVNRKAKAPGWEAYVRPNLTGWSCVERFGPLGPNNFGIIEHTSTRIYFCVVCAEKYAVEGFRMKEPA